MIKEKLISEISSKRNDLMFAVRVDCITFNHAPYIEDAMNGFCMQKTSFPFLAVIIDDASTELERTFKRINK